VIGVVAVAAAILTVLAACSGSGGNSTNSGASANAPGGQPIRAGFVNMEGGAVSLPEVRLGAEIGADYVNTKLGGVRGRPLTYLRCDVDGSPERSIDCANKMVEAKVPLVRLGVDVSSDAMLPILTSAGIPLVGHIAFGPQQLTNPHAFFLGIPTTAGALAPLKHYADAGKKSVAFVVADVPGVRVLPLLLAPYAASYGVNPTVSFYDQTRPDWNVLVTKAMASKPDVIGVPLATENDCTAFITAAQAAGFRGELFAGSCSTFMSALGAKAAGVVTLFDRWRPEALADAPPAKQTELWIFLDAASAAGKTKQVVGLAPATFADTVDLARILSTITGRIDGPAVEAAIKATKNLDGFLGPSLTCDGSIWKGQNGCSSSVVFYQAQADGTMRALGKDFVDVSSLTGG
jgi:branched-chain amino acid transport system substrate-binding protein